MLDLLKNAYYSLPLYKLKFFKYLPDRILFGKSYQSSSSLISTNTDLLKRNLRHILEYSMNHTRFGRDNIKAPIYEDEVFSILKSLPKIDPNDISGNLNYFVSDEYNRLNSYKTTTGGTGRAPVTIKLSNESYGIEWAYIHHIWSKLNYARKSDTKLTLRGKRIDGRKLTLYNPLYNEIVTDTFRLNIQNFPDFIKEAENYTIHYIHGYPSLVKEFKQYCELYSWKPEKLKGIMLGSETVQSSDWNDFESFFNCRIISWYGQTEKVILAFSEKSPPEYTVFTSYGYPYICDPDNKGFGEIIGTTFVNKALPLINYRTGDYATIEEQEDTLIIKNLEGRWGKDFVFLSEKKRIPTSSINLHSSVQSEILFYQIHQKEYGKIEITILPKASAKLSSNEILEEFKKNMEMNLHEFQIDYKIVEDHQIVKSARGKRIMLVQDLPNQFNKT